MGKQRNDLPLYASGGFTSYSDKKLQEQLDDWAAHGFKQVKMKVGREPKKDMERVKRARGAIGKDTALFVDANGLTIPDKRLKSISVFRFWSDLV